MKELSIEQKAKAYDEAIERAREYKKHGYMMINVALDNIFPELKESEDEKIRKAIINEISLLEKESIIEQEKNVYQSWIAWLEKQGQVKYSAISQHENITSKENDNSLTYEDERIRKAISQCIEDMRGQFEKLYSVHHKDAIAWLEKQGEKDEEILVLKDQIESLQAAIKAIKETHRIELERQGKEEYALKSFKDEDVRKFMQCIEKQAKAYEFNLPNRGYDIYAFAKDILVWLEKQGEQKFPIEKLPFETKTPEESLGIDSDTYNKIVDECIYGEQKPAWGEEDERFVHGLIRGLAAKRDIHGHTTFSSDCIDITKTISWLKSLKNRVQPNQEWSEEDSLMIDETLYFVQEFKRSDRCKNESDLQNAVTCEHFLKSLRPQNRWKPSDGQLDALQYVYRNFNPPLSDKLGWNCLKTLELMYQDLKKLKG